MYAKMNEGFDVEEEEVEMYRESTVGEVANIILGHCTLDLQTLDSGGIPMTPPVIVDHIKTIRRLKNTIFFTQRLDTPSGKINISLVGSKELLNTTV
jgi:CheY-specific phosphatase CheX